VLDDGLGRRPVHRRAPGQHGPFGPADTLGQARRASTAIAATAEGVAGGAVLAPDRGRSPSWPAPGRDRRRGARRRGPQPSAPVCSLNRGRFSDDDRWRAVSLGGWWQRGDVVWRRVGLCR
jgi:hypothetical protein